jgi:hypothetical protein
VRLALREVDFEFLQGAVFVANPKEFAVSEHEAVAVERGGDGMGFVEAEKA